MKAKRKQKRPDLFTDLQDIRKRLSGDKARDYLDRYIELKAKALELEKQGLEVRMLLPDFPRRPMLVIEKRRQLVPRRKRLT
jgi:hypothetical protein